MERSLPLLLALATGAAAQPGPPLPVPPVPPPPPGVSVFQDAPVPDRAFSPPSGGSVERPELAPAVIAAPETYRGETFTPGLAPTGNEDRLFSPAPGVMVRIPLKE